MGAHQTHPVNIEQICSFGARRYGDYTGYLEQSWIKWLRLHWTASYHRKKRRCHSKRRGGMWCRGTYASFWSPALPTAEGPDSSGSLSPSLAISARPLSARWRRRMEDRGKMGRLIEIIMWCTSVTVVSRVPRCLSHAGRSELSRAPSNHEWANPPAQA